MHLRRLIWLILFCIASPAMAGFSAGGGWLFLHFKRGANAAAISRLETLKRDFVKDYGNQAPTIVTPEVVRRRKEIYDLAFKVAEPDFAMAAQVDGYGRVLVGGGRISEAQPIFKKALDMRLHAAGAEPVWRLRAYQAFASAKLRGKGHEAEARRAAERAVRYWREHPRAGWEQMGSSEKDLYAVFDTDGIFGTYASSL